jgi:carbamoyl-phosphate synthase small subunit
MSSKLPALLVLEDGTTFRGFSFGATGTTTGELVFNTGMTGYQEVLTDPSYCGQIVTFTYPELGNTGINPEDVESSKLQVRGIVTRNIAQRPSNWRSTASLTEHLQQEGIVGIAGVDTRALTRHLRTQGSMNGAISTEILDPEKLLAQAKAAPSMKGRDLVPEVTTAESYTWEDQGDSQWEFRTHGTDGTETPQSLKVVALDFGIKWNILRRLVSYGCEVVVLPATSTLEEILSHQPDGVFLSNGPGDPAAVTYGIDTVKQLLDVGKPVFGICLGHQILGLALGGKTHKLKFGHRGLNQPASFNSRVEITSQNHGFVVDSDSFQNMDVEITHLNLNDSTVEGLRHRSLPVFSVQYHPEASPGPHDADYLFAEFVEEMKKVKV